MNIEEISNVYCLNPLTVHQQSAGLCNGMDGQKAFLICRSVSDTQR